MNNCQYKKVEDLRILRENLIWKENFKENVFLLKIGGYVYYELSPEFARAVSHGNRHKLVVALWGEYERFPIFSEF